MFKRLANKNFHVKRKKCTLFADNIEFLGHIVLHHSIEVCPNNISAINDWPIPTIVYDVQSFLGLCNQFDWFISKFAHGVWPLTDLTRKKLEFSWSPEGKQSFDALKQKLLDAPMLIIFNLASHSEVWCNASNFEVGAVLIQENTPRSPWQPVEYLSKHLNSAEYNYSAIEHEFVGLIQALHTWYHYLLGRPVTIRTDHASL